MDAVLLIGTRKGLWIGRSADRVAWELEGPVFPMTAVYATCIDTRRDGERGDGTRLLVGTMSEHWGPQVSWSDDLGATWSEKAGGGIRFPEGTGAALEQVWQLTPGAQPDEVWAGTQPSALFRSTDRGETFSLVQSLWDHPHRPDWGAGFGGQAIHTIVPDPADPDRVTVAMSTGGVYRTEDGGGSWSPHNTGISAYFFPDPLPEFGQCVHKVATHPQRSDLLYAQNHHGVYRSTDGGDTWVSIADGLPSDFGFPIVVHPGRPETVYVFPLVADSDRMPPGGVPRVWRSDDAGETWRELGKGLPDTSYAAVMRDAFSADDGPSHGLAAGLYLGARDGTVHASDDEGESWREVAAHLPDVMSVRAAMV